MGHTNILTENATIPIIQPLLLTGSKNSSYIIPGVYDLSVEDTNWVLTSSFIIFTMQTGIICIFLFSATSLKTRKLIVCTYEIANKKKLLTSDKLFLTNFFKDSVCLSLVVYR